MNFQIRPLQTSAPAGQASEQDLFDANGRLLLEKGKLISPEILEAIRKQEVYSITYNWTPNRPRMPLSKDHHKSLNLIKRLYYEVNLVRADSLSKANVILNRVLIEMENGSFSFVNLSALKTYDKLTYIHTINVALLAVVIGMQMGYAQEALHNLALGALLHDWGKLSVSTKVNISVNYVQNSVLRTTGDIIVTGPGSIASELEAGGSILIPNGKVRGGRLIARDKIKIYELGSPTGDAGVNIQLLDKCSLEAKFVHPVATLEHGTERLLIQDNYRYLRAWVNEGDHLKLEGVAQQ